MEPLPAAETLAAEQFPHAMAVFLGGSALSSYRTRTSDLDVVVVLPDPAAIPYWRTIRHQGWVVELFVHTPASLRHFWDRDAATRRATLLRMCAEGRILTSSHGAAETIQTEASARLEAGPAPATAEDLDMARYRVTDLLDDLAGCTDRAERAYIAAALLTAAAEMTLLHATRWLSSGKWLARHLAEHDADLAARIVRGHGAAIATGDPDELHQAISDVLHRTGGPLREGFHAVAEDSPARSMSAPSR